MPRKRSRNTSEEMKENYRYIGSWRKPDAWYPSVNPKDHYVFLTSLKRDNPSLYDSAAELLKLTGRIEKDADHFKNALIFLQRACDSERAKEINFLRSKLPKDTPIPNVGDEITYIRLLNKAIIEFENFQDRVVEERNRGIKRSYIQGTGGYIKSALNDLKGKNSTRNNNTIAAATRKALISLIGSKIRQGLSLEQLAATIGAAQAMILPKIKKELSKTEENKDGDILSIKVINKDYLLPDGKLNIEKIGKLIEQTDVYQSFFGKDSIESAEKLAKIGDHLNSKYNKVLTTEARNFLKKTFKKESLPMTKNKRGIDWKNVMEQKEIMASLEKANIEDIYTYDYTRNTGMAGEVRVYQDLRDTIVSLCGGTGGKTDVLSFDFGEVEIVEKNTKITVERNFNKIIDNIDKKTQGEFRKAGQEINKYYNNIERALVKNQSELEEIRHSFIIHNNIKDWSSAMDDDFSGFTGGTWTGLRIVDTLSAFNIGGDFSIEDIDWLKTCLVNTAAESIGASNKEGLEKYFSIFAAMLLFDDGLTIATDSLKKTHSRLNVLHLYPVNGVYVPSSYVMQMVHDYLINFELSDAAYAEINTGGVNFSEELASMSTKDNFIMKEKRWQAIRDKQIAAMVIRIKFLKNFRNLINSL